MSRVPALQPVRWEHDALVILDQTLLPTEVVERPLRELEEVWEAIRTLRVRGAPAIGIAAAFGLVLGLRHWRVPAKAPRSWEEARRQAAQAGERLKSSRPTAVNLAWAVDRLLALLDRLHENPHGDTAPGRLWNLLLDEAQKLIEEDHAVCRAMGQHGLTLLKEGDGVLTHCNAGGLATAGFGTALAPIYAAHEKGMRLSVFADETRPLLQGARLTAFELQRAGVPVTLICDNMAATVMARGKIQCVIVGADRVAANGDFANKIGTYGVAILAREHDIPFYCATPLSTVDRNLPDGGGIPIEERAPEEITRIGGRVMAPEGVAVFNPAFDVTPHRLVTAFITEKGVIRPPYTKTLAALFPD